MGFILSGITLIHCYANNHFANVSFAKLYASNLGNVQRMISIDCAVKPQEKLGDCCPWNETRSLLTTEDYRVSVGVK
jgi:hypothetical protein